MRLRFWKARARSPTQAWAKWREAGSTWSRKDDVLAAAPELSLPARVSAAALPVPVPVMVVAVAATRQESPTKLRTEPPRHREWPRYQLVPLVPSKRRKSSSTRPVDVRVGSRSHTAVGLKNAMCRGSSGSFAGPTGAGAGRYLVRTGNGVDMGGEGGGESMEE